MESEVKLTIELLEQGGWQCFSQTKSRGRIVRSRHGSGLAGMERTYVAVATKGPLYVEIALPLERPIKTSDHFLRPWQDVLREARLFDPTGLDRLRESEFD
jgi:hypothetical protein